MILQRHNRNGSALPLLLAARNGVLTLIVGLKCQEAVVKRLGVIAGRDLVQVVVGSACSDLITPVATATLRRRRPSGLRCAANDAALPILGRVGDARQGGWRPPRQPSLGPTLQARVPGIRAKTSLLRLKPWLRQQIALDRDQSVLPTRTLSVSELGLNIRLDRGDCNF